MSPKVIAILVVILLVIIGGMALTMKRAADKRRDRAAWAVPAEAGVRGTGSRDRGQEDHSIRRCFIA